jgi:hypothetical protein
LFQINLISLWISVAVAAAAAVVVAVAAAAAAVAVAVVVVVVVDWRLRALQHLWSLMPLPFIFQSKLSILGITQFKISD